MKRVAAFILGILSVISAGVWAVSGGGFPSRPTFQAVRVGSPRAVAFGSTDSASTYGSSARNAALWNYSGASTGSMRILENVYYNGSTFLAINTGPSAQLNTEDGMICLETAPSVTGGTSPTFGTCRFQVDSVGNITAPNATSVPWTSQTSGTFTSTLSTGCTTTPTATISWVKTGSIVTVWWPATTWNCTSNTSTKTTDASIPVAERPTTTKCLGILSGENNTAAAIMTAQVTSSGTLNFGIANSGTGASDCNGVNSTTSGTFAIDSASFTYTLQ